MGGHNAGEVASRLAVDTILEVLSRPASNPNDSNEWPFGFDESLSPAGNLIRTAIHAADRRIVEMAATSDNFAGMGTTIVVALLVDGRLVVGHVGDSRLYRLSEGKLRQLTADDSWIASMLERNPQVSLATLQHHPMRNALTNVVGAGPDTVVHVIEESLADGDLLLLTTDGVHGVLGDRRLQELLVGCDDLGRAAADIVSAAIAAGSRDNCTAIVAKYQRD
jgi:protein phosphatase